MINFVKKHSTLILIAILFILTAALFIRQSQGITAKELVKRENEILNTVKAFTDKEIQESYAIIKNSQQKIKNFEIQLESLNFALERNRKALNENIKELNRLKNEIKSVNYTNFSDSALLERLRATN
jgi:peptidoglycan hydrolase CwlO-like protein